MEVLLSLEGLQICMEFSLLLFFFLLMGGGALNRMEWLRKRNLHIAFLQMSVVCVCKIQNLSAICFCIVRLLLDFGPGSCRLPISPGLSQAVLKIYLSNGVKKIWFGVVHAVVWSIWLELNHRLYQDKQSNPQDGITSWNRLLGFLLKQCNEYT